MKCVCFVGHNGSGKSTAAKELARILRKRGESVKLMSLAEPVKMLTSTYLNIDKLEDRYLLEDFAEQLKYMFGKTLYIDYLIREHNESSDYLIIDDLRFAEEIDELVKYIPDTTVMRVGRNVPASKKDEHRLVTLDTHISHSSIDYYVLDCDLSNLQCSLEVVDW